MREYALSEIAQLVDGKLIGDSGAVVAAVASLSQAKLGDISVIQHVSHCKQLQSTAATAVIMSSLQPLETKINTIICSDPIAAIMKCVQLFACKQKSFAQVSSTACIDKTVTLGQRVKVGQHTIIHPNARIGDDCQLGDNVVIGENVILGKQVTIADNSVIHQGSWLEDKVELDYACVIGAKPFNYYKTKGKWYAGPALANVILSKEVKVGANTVIDRGSLNDTFIGPGVVIDNLVQIAHDVIIGAGTSIAGCAAIGAYTQIGEHCCIGGGAAIASMVSIADDIVITGMSTVSKSLVKPGIYSSGTTVSPHKRWRRNAGRFHRLDNYIERLKRLEKQVL